jgi:hypothetical protein
MRIEDYLDIQFNFSPRPSPLDAELRVSWRLPLLLLILNKCCRQNRSTVLRLNILNSALNNKFLQRQLFALLERQLHPGDILIRVDPTLNLVINYGLAENLIRRMESGQLELTDKGIGLAILLDRKNGLFEREKLFLNSLGKRLTEVKVNEINTALQRILL